MRRTRLFVLLLPVLLVTFALRVFRLDVQSLWYDEAFSVYLAQFDLAEISARTAADIQPPLYYFLLHFWMGLAGDREFAVRFLSLAFGVLTIPLLYVTARRLFDSSTAVITALLAMLAPLYIWYSQEARMYTLITFLLLLSSYALVRAVSPSQNAHLSFRTRAERGREISHSGLKNEISTCPATPAGRCQGRSLRSLEMTNREGLAVEMSGTRRWWIAFAAANIAAVYTHYFALVVIAFQLLYVVVSRFQGFRVSGFQSKPANLKPETLKPGTLSFAAIVVAFLPWLPFLLTRLGQDTSYWRGALKLDEALRHIAISFATGESVLEAQAQWIAVGWVALVTVGTLAKAKGLARKAKGREAVFAILYLVVPLALLLFLFYRNPKFNARYLMIASPAFFLLLAAGLAQVLSLVRARNVAARALGLVFSLLAFSFLLFTSAYADYNAYFDPAFTKAQFREVAQYIDEHIQPGEAILLTSGHLFPAFNYYYDGDAPQVRLPDDGTLNTDHVLGYDAARVLNQTIKGARGVWVVQWQDEVVDPNGFIPMFLSRQGQEQKIGSGGFYHVRLRHWTLKPDAYFESAPQPGTVRAANFKDRVKLLGFDTPNATPADTGASFNLYWQVLARLGDDYMVALRVRDAAGNVWGKQDRRPAGYTYPTTRWKPGENLFGAYTVPLAAGAPAGDYFADVTFYTASDMSGLDVLAPSGAPVGKSVRIGPIPVLPAAQPAAYAALNIKNSISQTLGPFTLLGYALERDKASAGESIPLTLFWRADAKPERDYALRLWFDHLASEPFALANAQFLTSEWRAGEVVRGQYNVQIPPDAAAGTQTLKLTLEPPSGDGIALAPFTVEKTDRTFVKPHVTYSQPVTFGNGYLSLVGYDVEPTLQPGGNLTLTLVWQARGTLRVDKSYTVFVHLLDGHNQIAAGRDSPPVNGTRPTTGWVAGEFIVDTFELALKPETIPGKYQIEIGWYDAQDPGFARLSVLDDNGVPAGDHIILNTAVNIGQ